LTYTMHGGAKPSKVALAYCEVLYNINNNAVSGYTPFDACAPKKDTGGGGGGGGEDDNGDCLAGDVENGNCVLINDCDDQAVEFHQTGYQATILNPGQMKSFGPQEACSDLTDANRQKYRTMCKDDGKECAGWVDSCGAGSTVAGKTLDEYCSKTCGVCGPVKCLMAGITKNKQCELINTCADEPTQVKPEGFNAITVEAGKTAFYDEDVCEAAPGYSRRKYLTQCKDGRKDKSPNQCPGWKAQGLCTDKYTKVGTETIAEFCPFTCGCH